MTQQLIDEGRVFEQHLDEWRGTHLGEFVLIKGSELVGFYPSLGMAFEVGTKRFGLDPFFIKQIVPGDTVNVSLFGQRLLASR